MPQPARRLHQGAMIAQRLTPALHDLERLMADLEAGVRSQRDFDDLEQRAQHIAADIRAPFRKV